LLLLLLPLLLLSLWCSQQVLEAQAALGGMTTCDKPSAVQLLWGLGIAGALSYELWDVLSTPLDNEAEPLGPDALLRVFEAYCLAVLRNTGPAPCLILMQQLVPAGNEFCKSVLGDGQESQHKLLQALVRAGLVPPEARATRVVDGHMMLFDVLSEGGFERVCFHAVLALRQHPAALPLQCGRHVQLEKSYVRT
jgi:hypothetical protein